jgi:hypothetical protein
MVIAAVILVIVMFAVAIVVSDNIRGYNSMFNRIYSDVVTDSHVAKRMFDSVVRKSCSGRFSLDDSGRQLEVHYYADSNSAVPDRYMFFYQQDDHLNVDYGRILNNGSKEILDEMVVCGNVSGCTFKQTGRSLQMILTLNNGSQELTTVTSAVMHN